MTLKDSFNRTVTAFGERGPLNAGQPSPLASRPGTSDNVEARPDRGASTRSSSRGEVMDGHHDAQSLRRQRRRPAECSQHPEAHGGRAQFGSDTRTARPSSAESGHSPRGIGAAQVFVPTRRMRRKPSALTLAGDRFSRRRGHDT